MYKGLWNEDFTFENQALLTIITSSFQRMKKFLQENENYGSLKSLFQLKGCFTKQNLYFSNFATESKYSVDHWLEWMNYFW
jgi:hypothetical protein